ncbi:neurotransmitter-gated ion-channel ligand-binding protein [Stylonychia lemnae]|uniref:Neurotransmitter-gated ion-channel ligand-binding protein n=1 Tax=Stylonychia lemnae TaxID=5949 RepID=A0A078A1U9_STYLE|nr:neurotransmitter-gated ion-channel ligand-binding protein [Stylonychia lemnae]|eukprot:CDW75438.1 neurotransmitter-gated ion-channel ligand-binding protein [Stylonychia lemnae]
MQKVESYQPPNNSLPPIVLQDLLRTPDAWPVGIQINVYNILKIDTGGSQVFQASFIVKVTWYDEKYKDIPKDKTVKNLDDIELPRIQVMNAQEIDSFDIKLKACVGGLMFYQTRYKATIKENFELQNFPFDFQPLHIRLRATSSGQHLVFHESFRNGGNDPCKFEDTTLADFEFIQPLTRVIFDNKKSRNELTYQIIYKRARSYYYSHIYLPLLILEFITFSLALIDPADGFADAINIILVSLLTQIAFRLGLADILPKVSYLTLVDYYFLTNIIYSLLLCIFEIIFFFVEKERDERIYYFLGLFGTWFLFNIVYFYFLTHQKFTLEECDYQLKLLAGKTNSITMRDVKFIKKEPKTLEKKEN